MRENTVPNTVTGAAVYIERFLFRADSPFISGVVLYPARIITNFINQISSKIWEFYGNKFHVPRVIFVEPLFSMYTQLFNTPHAYRNRKIFHVYKHLAKKTPPLTEFVCVVFLINVRIYFR